MAAVPERGPVPEDLVQSVSKALHVLEVVTHSPGLPVKAIARRSGLNLSTTYHLVRTLAYDQSVDFLSPGFLERFARRAGAGADRPSPSTLTRY